MYGWQSYTECVGKVVPHRSVGKVELHRVTQNKKKRLMEKSFIGRPSRNLTNGDIVGFGMKE